MDPFDLASLFALRELLDGLSRPGPPRLRTVTAVAGCRHVALLPGSYNPVTSAHMLLAERALRDGYDCVVFVLSRTTLGKRPHGLMPEDRLLTLRAACTSPLIVSACSHGLYADQAEAAARLFPGVEISVLVGSDKVLQIFDPSWYEDREQALRRLFSEARLVVAPRSDQGDLLRETLAAPQNRAWRDRVEVLRLHPAVGDLSSTRVRGLLRSGADSTGLVPAAVAELLAGVRAFAPPLLVETEEVDAYDVRRRLVDLLWTSRGHEADRVDLRALMRTATAPGEPGRRLRALISNGIAGAEELARAVGA
jgi:nicotinic acid mononucleotide adenylyltransferase